jgi:hypothetical protein
LEEREAGTRQCGRRWDVSAAFDEETCNKYLMTTRYAPRSLLGEIDIKKIPGKESP